ncbi:hypothetical protein [Halococcus sp. IIIV-5B]
MIGKAVGLALADNIQQAAEDAAEEVLAEAREIAEKYDSKADIHTG